MSNFCRRCEYDYRQATGEQACPFATPYWDFLDRHYKQLQRNHRLGLQKRHVDENRRTKEVAEIRSAAKQLKRKWSRRVRARGHLGPTLRDALSTLGSEKLKGG